MEFRRSLDDEDAFHRLVCGIRGVEPGPGQAVYKGECPYRGLQFFDVEHAPFFFGREALTGWLLNALRGDNRFLAIVGPSGSGKSSLARAGLVAALGQGEIEGSAGWPVVICRPGPDPLESLAVALSKVVPQTPLALREMTDTLRADEQLLHATARLALRDAPPERRLVVLVDQFEEAFTLCRDEALRQALVKNLLYAAHVIQGQTMVLLTLRADFYGKCAANPALAAALSEHQFLVGPMAEDELRQAIERPAQRVGCEFESGLVDLLLHDVQGQPGGLPLLQHALLELWGRREGRRLTLAAYQAIGRVEGALQQRAEAVYGSLAESEQEICRRIFLRLTQPGEGTEDTKRRVAFQELLPADGPRQATVEAVVQRLAGQEVRLVTTEGEGTLPENQFVEVAHEALIRGWPRLQAWIDENRAALRIQRRLTEAARDWEENNRDESYLYRGARLAEMLAWSSACADDLSLLECTFLEASVKLQDTLRRMRWKEKTWPTVLAGLLGGGLGGIAGALVGWQVGGVKPGDVPAAIFGYLIFGALGGGLIALSIGLGAPGSQWRRRITVAGGATAGMVVGVLLYLLYSDWWPTLWFPIASGGVFGGGVALSVVLGRSWGRLKRIPVRAAMGALFGVPAGFMLQDFYFGVLLGFGIAASVGVVDDFFQVDVI